MAVRTLKCLLVSVAPSFLPVAFKLISPDSGPRERVGFQIHPYKTSTEKRRARHETAKQRTMCSRLKRLCQVLKLAPSSRSSSSSRLLKHISHHHLLLNPPNSQHHDANATKGVVKEASPAPATRRQAGRGSRSLVPGGSAFACRSRRSLPLACSLAKPGRRKGGRFSHVRHRLVGLLRGGCAVGVAIGRNFRAGHLAYSITVVLYTRLSGNSPAGDASQRSN